MVICVPGPLGPKEEDGLLLPPVKACLLLTGHMTTEQPLWFEPAHEIWFQVDPSIPDGYISSTF